jgi:hypothetical protein
LGMSHGSDRFHCVRCPVGGVGYMADALSEPAPLGRPSSSMAAADEARRSAPEPATRDRPLQFRC